MLQDLTEPDIKIYITSKLDSNVAFKELQIMDVKIAESLIEEIARKSSRRLPLGCSRSIIT